MERSVLVLPLQLNSTHSTVLNTIKKGALHFFASGFGGTPTQKRRVITVKGGTQKSVVFTDKWGTQKKGGVYGHVLTFLILYCYYL